MPPIERPADTRLISTYQEAALRILRTLQEAKPNNRTVILARINVFLSQLDEITAEYVREQIPIHFKAGSEEAIKLLRATQFDDIDETFGTIHKQALQSIVDDATMKFADTLIAVRRSSRGRLNDVAKRGIIAEMAALEIEGDTKAAAKVKGIFEEEKISGFTKSNGTRISLENYAATLTRTILAEAHNTGAGTRYLSNGVRYGTVIERGDAPDRVCQFMRGKIVGLADRRLWGPFHPNCMGGIAPVLTIPEDAIVFETAEDSRIPQDVYFYLNKSR